MGRERDQHLPDRLSIHGVYIRGLQRRKLRRGRRCANYPDRRLPCQRRQLQLPERHQLSAGNVIERLHYGVFTAGQFTVPTAGTNGNERFNAFRNPSFIQTDMSIYKNTHITERLVFQFRFEFYNLFNHANFQNIQGDISQGNFGQVTAPDPAKMVAIGR